MAEYRLAPEADADLLSIARYTIETWGDEQAKLYESRLQRCFEAIACGEVRGRKLIRNRPELWVSRCEHHYIFYRLQRGRPPLIVAVLHESMDLMQRLRDRLD